jgi:hypothetical protein
MQVRTGTHVDRNATLEENYEKGEHTFDEDGKRFFKLFTESTPEGSRAAAREMKKIATRQTKQTQKVMLFHSISLLMRTDSKKLRWPNSPLRIMLQFVDANMHWATAQEKDLPEDLATGLTPLHHLSSQADPKHHSFHKNQVILGQQLFRHGANANLDALPHGRTPLHIACHPTTVTNLDFIQLLLEKGANPNFQDSEGRSPVMSTVKFAPGAAKFLLEWPTSPPTTDIDIHITNRAGVTLLGLVHSTVEAFSDHNAQHDSPDQRATHVFLLQQWREIEKMLEERGAAEDD